MEKCRWRLKINDGEYREFKTLDDVKNFISINRSKYNWTTDPDIIEINSSSYVANILKQVAQDIQDLKTEPIIQDNYQIGEELLDQADSKTIGVTTVITTPNNKGERMVPQLIDPIYRTELYKTIILDYLIEQNKLDLTKYGTVNDSTTQLRENAKTELFKKYPKHQVWKYFVIEDNELEFYVNDILGQFDLETTPELVNSFREKMRDTVKANFRIQLKGEFIHNLLYNYLHLHKSDAAIKTDYYRIMAYVNKHFSELYKNQEDWVKEEVENFDVSQEDFNAYVDKLLPLIIRIRKRHTKDAQIFSEVNIMTKLGYVVNNKEYIRGKIDLLVVDNGQVTIYDFKYAKNPYDQWAYEKKLTTVYQFAFYNRILSQLGINGDKVNHVIIPMYATDKNSLIVEEFQDITTQSNQNFVLNNIDQYLPRITYTEYRDPEEFANIDKQLSKVIPEEHIVLKTWETDEESAYNRYVLKNGKLRKDSRGKIYFFDPLQEKYISVPTEEAAREWVRDYLEKIKDERPRIINQTVNYIEQVINGADPDSLVKNDGDTTRRAFYRYWLGKYQGKKDRYFVDTNPNLLNRGLVVVVDIYTQSVDVYNIESLGLDDSVKYSEKTEMKTLFDKIAPYGTEEYSLMESLCAQYQLPVLKGTRGNIGVLKALMVLNDFEGLATYKIADVTTINPIRSESKSLTKKEIYFISELFQNIMSDVNGNDYKSNLLTVKSGPRTGSNRIVSIIDKSLTQIRALLDNNENKLQNVSDRFSKIEEAFISYNLPNGDRQQLISELENFLYWFTSKYNINPSQFNIDSEEKTIYAWVNIMYLSLKDMELYDEGYHAKIFGKGVTNWLDSFMINSIDTIGSGNIVQFRQLMANMFQNIRERYTTFLGKNRVMTDRYESHCDPNLLGSQAVGMKAVYYRNLYRTDTYDLTFKDPWDPNESLSTYERTYLKYVISEITGKQNREELNEDDFLVPLVRARLASSLVSAGFDITQHAKNAKDATFQWIYDTFAERGIEQEKAADTMDQMVFEFEDRTNRNKRQRLIDQYGVNDFETNTELILALYKMAQIKTQEVNKILPTIRALQVALSLKGALTGKDMSTTIEFIFDTTKSSIYEESLVPEEMRGLFRFITGFRSAASTIALSWNVANLPRELLMGFWTNVGNAAMRRYGKESFGLKDYAKALQYLLYDSPHFIQEITKIELLNEFYALANMDVKNMVENTASYKNGIVGGFSRYSGWWLTAPDYWNRMSIFLAQMIHDGCFDAHYIDKDDNGVEYLKYDITKDKRFDVYFKYKDHVVPDNIKAKYEQQYGLYLAMLQEFNRERKIDNKPLYKIGDKFDRAYTVLQRESIKSFADESFGYYDHETKSEWNKVWQGMLFKQFMTYLSAKKTQYYLARTTIAAQGHFVPVVGKANQQKYIKIVTDEMGHLVDREIVDEDTGIPLYRWEGRVMEGILQTYIQLFKDLYGLTKKSTLEHPNLSPKEIWDKYVYSNTIESSNIKASLWDMTVWLLLAKLIRLALLDDPDAEGKGYKQQIAELSWWARNGMDIALRSLEDVGIVNAVSGGLLNWNPPMLGILNNTIRNFNAAFKVEDINFVESLVLGTTNSFGVFRMVRQDISDAIKD